MLEANKSIWFEKIFTVYNRHLLRRRFHSLNISGIDYLKNTDEELPLIIYANHSSWWDGLVVLEILRKFDFESYVMMEEKQLRKLFFFRWLGAFSVVRENPREAVESVKYAVNLLRKSPDRLILIFPQGEILPNDVRPLHFYNGLARIVEKVKNCYVVPLVLRFEFLGNFKPEIFVKIGAPKKFAAGVKFDTRNVTANFEEKLTAILESLKLDITLKKTAEYDKIF